MSEHLLTDDIKNYLNREMKPAELLKADDHLTQCEACFKKVNDSAFAENATGFDFLNVSPEEPEHLQYEQLEKYADEKSGVVEREIADVHLQVCDDCRAELNGLIEMRKLVETDLKKQIVPQQSAEKTIFAQVRKIFTGNNFLKFGFAAVALVILALTIFWLTKREPTSEIAVIPSPSNANLRAAADETPPVNVETKAPQNNNANLQNQSPVEVKANDFPAVYKAEVERVLVADRLNLPAELGQLNAQNGKLMSGSSESVPFVLENPLGKIIQTDRPQFRWRALADADGYIVNIYDANFNRVAGSSQVKTTSWQIDRPLTRNKIYIWQVTALKDGQEIKSPIRPAPDAKFKVIDAAKSNELARLSRQYKSEHLALGILYANAGLLDEATREFQKEIAKNPDSKPARKFLQDIRRLK